MKITLSNIHFETLGVTRYSTKIEIKKAYWDLIKKWHPDKFSNQPNKILEALDRSKKINEAFSLLENYQAPTKPSTSFNNSTSNSEKTAPSHKKNQPKTTSRQSDIERIKVKSSNIHSIGYDAAKKVLQVEFLNGSIYQYYNVPETIYTELIAASSKGKYFNSKVAFNYKYKSV